MTKFLTENKSIVVPGEIIAEGILELRGDIYRDGNYVRASRLGLLNTENKTLLPLSGRYVPYRGDVIICKVIDVNLNGWRLDTNSAYSAMLPLKEGVSEFVERGADLTQFYALGDYILCKITNVTSQKLVDVTTRGPGLKKLSRGRIISVNTHKVPRIIGKQGTMVGMIKEATGCRIIVGQNGLIWIDGEPESELLAVETIKKIERESHVSGLTESIKSFLERESDRKIESIND